MGELYKYICPSCGANLYPAEADETVTCSFCGSVFDRRAIMDKQRILQAQKIAKQLKEYKHSLNAHRAVENKVMRLTEEVTELSQQSEPKLPLWSQMLIPILIAGALLLLFMLIAAVKADSKPMLISTAMLTMAFFVFLIAAGSKKRKIRRIADGTNGELRSKLFELDSARKELTESQNSFDISLVPEQYRTDRALDRLIELFSTAQASSLGEGFRLYDKAIYRENMQQMKQQQLDIQKQQLQKLEELSDYDFDDTYDDDDFELAETAAAVRSTIALTQEEERLRDELSEQYDDL